MPNIAATSPTLCHTIVVTLLQHYHINITMPRHHQTHRPNIAKTSSQHRNNITSALPLHCQRIANASLNHRHNVTEHIATTLHQHRHTITKPPFQHRYNITNTSPRNRHNIADTLPRPFQNIAAPPANSSANRITTTPAHHQHIVSVLLHIANTLLLH